MRPSGARGDGRAARCGWSRTDLTCVAVAADGLVGEAEGPIIEGDASEMVGELPEFEGGSRREADESVRYSLAWWLSFLIPVSIAVVAIMGALVGYRAEYHASLSTAADNDAVVASTYASGHDYDALLTGQAVDSDHALWEELTGAKGNGTGRPATAASESACAAFILGTVSVAAAQGTVDCQLAQVFSGYALPAYWVHGNPADFDTQRFVADWIALSNVGRDVAVSRHTAVANDQRHRELRLLWLGMLLALALAFCTLAQAAIHHRWSKRSTRTGLLLAVPGWMLLAACSTVLLAWEL
jgi:hypothetical protein